MKIRKAVIPAAGWGTRFLPATKVLAKEMIPLIDKPLVQYIVEEAVASGIEEIIMITSFGKGVMEDHFDRDFELEYMLEQRGEKTIRGKQTGESSGYYDNPHACHNRPLHTFNKCPDNESYACRSAQD